MEIKKLSIIIPAYNEENRIGETLQSYSSYFMNLKKNKKLDFEIVVVINNTTDGTENVVRKYSKKYSEIKYLNFKRGGKGFAITKGFKDALKRKNDLIGFTDADGSTPPRAFYGLVRNLGNYDGIIANRWDKRSKIKMKQPLSRRILSRGYNFIVRSLFLFPYPDTQCGAKIFTREILEKRIGLMASAKWNYDVALLFCLKKGGAKIKSIPTMWEDKDKSKISVTDTPIKMFISLVRLRLMHSPLKFIVDFYNKLPEKLKFHTKI